MIPTHYVPSCEEINRLNLLQYMAGHYGVAVAMPKDYTFKDITVVAQELSEMCLINYEEAF